MYQTVQNTNHANTTPMMTGGSTAYNTTNPLTGDPNAYNTTNPMTGMAGTRTVPVTNPSMTDKCLPTRNKTGLGFGTVTFRPLEARFNHDKDFLTKMDPYCKFKLGFHRGKSSVAKRQGKNPIWNDVITLKSKGQEFAKVKCKDRDRLSLNDRLGKAHIPLGSVYATGKTSQWYPLQKGDKVTGEILVEIEFHPNTVL